MKLGLKNRGVMTIILILFLIPAVTIMADEKHPEIYIEEDTWDFGYVPFDYDMVHIFKVENRGKAPLAIYKTMSNCDCTTSSIKDTLVPSGGATQLRIDFWTTDYYGSNERYVEIKSNDPDNPVIKASYTSNIGTLPVDFGVDPKSLFFLPTHKAKDIKLFNNSERDLGFILIPTIDSVFTLEKSEGVIKPGESVPINIAARDDLPRGTFHSSFIVQFETDIHIRTTVPIKIVRY
jgi:hypothetical protein